MGRPACPVGCQRPPAPAPRAHPQLLRDCPARGRSYSHPGSGAGWGMVPPVRPTLALGGAGPAGRPERRQVPVQARLGPACPPWAWGRVRRPRQAASRDPLRPAPGSQRRGKVPLSPNPGAVSPARPARALPHPASSRRAGPQPAARLRLPAQRPGVVLVLRGLGRRRERPGRVSVCAGPGARSYRPLGRQRHRPGPFCWTRPPQILGTGAARGGRGWTLASARAALIGAPPTQAGASPRGRSARRSHVGRRGRAARGLGWGAGREAPSRPR